MLSIVVPAYNESAGIEQFHDSILVPELQKISPELNELLVKYSASNLYEIIYVNDGSSDNTLEKLYRISGNYPNVKVVDLSRNFGKEIATTAGISQADSEAIIIMDADGQHPPSCLEEFIDKWQNGSQVVVGVRSNHQGRIFKTIGSKLFYRILNSISESRTVPNSTDYRLITKSVAQEFLKFGERKRIARGLIDWSGFKRDYVTFEAPERIAGEATYDMAKLIGLALNSFTTMSIKPLFIFGYLGCFITFFSFVSGLVIFIEQILFRDPFMWNFTGSALLGIFITFLVGILLVSQGILAVYMSHIYVQTQGRPMYIINKEFSRNLDYKR